MNVLSIGLKRLDSKFIYKSPFQLHIHHHRLRRKVSGNFFLTDQRPLRRRLLFEIVYRQSIQHAYFTRSIIRQYNAN